MSSEIKVQIAGWLLDPDHPKRFLDSSLAVLESELKKQGLEKIYSEIELPLAKILEEIHQVGIKVDLDFLKKLSIKAAKELEQMTKRIYELAGTPFNLNSPKQLSEVLYEKLKIDFKGVPKTKTGLRTTDAEALETIKARHPVVALILDYRELFKIYSTYIEPLRNLAGPDGRVRTTFLQTNTATGRLSSQNPNLQNIPAPKGRGSPRSESGRAIIDYGEAIRKSFIAEEGFSLAAFDYSQIELRVLASVSDDKRMIDAFKKGLDIHALTASNVYNVDISKVTPEMRRFAKTLNFGVVYGMGSDSFARSSGLSREEAQTFIAEYFNDFNGVRQWQEKTIQAARDFGYVENLNGRRRILENINFSNRRLAAEAERMAINMPIQSLAADIIKVAMIRIARIFKDKGLWMKKVRMLLSIHDELLFEISDDILKETIPLIEKEMEAAYKLKVPLKVDLAYGKNWAEL